MGLRVSKRTLREEVLLLFYDDEGEAQSFSNLLHVICKRKTKFNFDLLSIDLSIHREFLYFSQVSENSPSFVGPLSSPDKRK